MAINNICIIGGGTAGWLAANHLGSSLAKTTSENGQSPQVQITLIESPDIPTIGVGEGTVPTIRESLARFGIKESEFIRRCDATFKQSIKFINWMDNGAQGVVHSFHHLFDAPSPFGHVLSNYWLQNQTNAGVSISKKYAKLVVPQWYSCERNLAPKTADMPDYKGAHAFSQTSARGCSS
ncbi:tryptophan 7-halogenase [Thalassotalea fusca]